MIQLQLQITIEFSFHQFLHLALLHWFFLFRIDCFISHLRRWYGCGEGVVEGVVDIVVVASGGSRRPIDCTNAFGRVEYVCEDVCCGSGNVWLQHRRLQLLNRWSFKHRVYLISIKVDN